MTVDPWVYVSFGALLGFILTAAIQMMFVGIFKPELLAEAMSEADLGFDEEAGMVDPWHLQRSMMEASDQELPHEPELNRTSLLYYRLILEEVAEMGRTLDQILLRQQAIHGGLDLVRVRHSIRMVSQTLESWVVDLKTVPFPDITIPLKRSEAKALLDDHTDVQVVNSGFSLACGLPGPIGYLRTQVSNLSKRFHDGKIHKDPTGKWVKGPAYQMPHFDDLFDHLP